MNYEYHQEVEAVDSSDVLIKDYPCRCSAVCDCLPELGVPPRSSQPGTNWADHSPLGNQSQPTWSIRQEQRDPENRHSSSLECQDTNMKQIPDHSWEHCSSPWKGWSGRCWNFLDLRGDTSWYGRKGQTWSLLHCSMMWDGCTTEEIRLRKSHRFSLVLCLYIFNFRANRKITHFYVSCFL